MASTTQFRHIQFVVLFITSLSSDILASDMPPSVCTEKTFDNNYYLVNISDVPEVSRFYLNIENNHFKELTGFTAITGEKLEVIRYFDFDDLQVLHGNKEVFLSLNSNLPVYRTEREEAIFKDNNESSTSIHRFEVRNYKTSSTTMDKHALFGRVKRSERPKLARFVAGISGEPPESISEKLTVKHQDIVYLINHYGTAYGAVTLGNFSIDNFGTSNTHTLFKIEYFPYQKPALTEHEQKLLVTALCSANKAFRKQFPHIAPKPSFGYSDYQALASAALPNRNFFSKYPLLFDLGQILILSSFGFLLIYLILGRYSQGKTYRRLTRTAQKNRHDK